MEKRNKNYTAKGEQMELDKYFRGYAAIDLEDVYKRQPLYVSVCLLPVFSAAI